MGVEFRVLVAKGVLIPDADLEGVDGLGSTGRVTRYSQGFYCYDHQEPTASLGHLHHADSAS